MDLKGYVYLTRVTNAILLSYYTDRNVQTIRLKTWIKPKQLNYRLSKKKVGTIIKKITKFIKID